MTVVQIKQEVHCC